MLNTKSIPKGASLTVVFSAIFGTVKYYLFKNFNHTLAVQPKEVHRRSHRSVLFSAESSLSLAENRLNQLAVITLTADFTTGALNQPITNPAFDVPTTMVANDGSLYFVNARFGIAGPDAAAYWVVRIDNP